MADSFSQDMQSAGKHSVVHAGRRLHIAFVADCLDGHMGGGMVSAQRFVQKLEERHDVVVLGTGEPRADRVHLPALYVPGRKNREMGFTFAVPRRHIVRDVLAKADVVHLQYPFWLSYVALDEAKRLGKPVVAALHVQPENFLYNVGVHSPRVADRLFRYWVERYYNSADLVLCPSVFAETKAREHGLTAPVTIISNGASPELQVQALEREVAHQGRFLILSLGRFGAEKRQDLLLRALALSRHQPRISVVVGGAGPREGRLKRLAARLPLPVEVGYLTPARLLRLLNTADLFVHASEVELEGMAVLDAMSVGLPALVAQAPQSAASQFALDENFAFPAGDEQTLAARIDALIEQPELLQEARGRARAAAEVFQFPQSVDKLQGAYEELVAGIHSPIPRLRVAAGF